MKSSGMEITLLICRKPYTNLFFLEVAKIRALRELWALIVKECGGSEESAKISLHARTATAASGRPTP